MLAQAGHTPGMTHKASDLFAGLGGWGCGAMQAWCEVVFAADAGCQASCRPHEVKHSRCRRGLHHVSMRRRHSTDPQGYIHHFRQPAVPSTKCRTGWHDRRAAGGRACACQVDVGSATRDATGTGRSRAVCVLLRKCGIFETHLRNSQSCWTT